MTASHTPGPWVAGVVLYRGSETFGVVKADDTEKVVALCGFVGATDEPESIANARLIAAAPYMLWVMKRIRMAIDPDDWCGDERMSDVIDAAVAKAEGGAA